MPEIKFGCTLCGKCCQGHSLPLTLDESIAWLEDGGRVEIFCEAHPYVDGDARAEHRRRRSFRVKCGTAVTHVTAILVGVISGSCQNLGDDLKCRIYDRRPIVCRIYPAEISPFIQLNVAAKACPPEAWTSGETLVREGKLVDDNLRRLVELSKQTDRDDVPQKMLVCCDLGLSVSAVAEDRVMSPTGLSLRPCWGRCGARGRRICTRSRPFEIRSFEPSAIAMGDAIVDLSKILVECIPLLRQVGDEANRLTAQTEAIGRKESEVDEL